MAETEVRCPHCQSEAVVRWGRVSNGKERFRGQQYESCGRVRLGAMLIPGACPRGKRQSVERTLKGSGVREIARCRSVRTTVLKESNATL